MSDIATAKWVKHVRSDEALCMDFTPILNPSLTLSSGAAVAITATSEASVTLAASAAINGSTFTDRANSSTTVAANKGVVLTWTGDGTVGETYKCEVSATDSGGITLTRTVMVVVRDQ